jgi:hypothetical protein
MNKCVVSVIEGGVPGWSEQEAEREGGRPFLLGLQIGLK